MTPIINNRNASPAAFGSVLHQLFPKNLTTLLDDAFWGAGVPATSSIPPVNIRETASGYELELAAPGLHKSDFNLKIDGETLTISVAKQDNRQPEANSSETAPGHQQENTPSRWVRREFMHSSFQRHFELGETIDRDNISARYEDGILHLTMPRKENLRPASRQININ